MDRKIYNVVRPREDKEGKTFWDRHGVLIVKDGRLSLHLASIPTGEWDGWFHVYPREEAQQGNGRGNGRDRAASAPSQGHADFDDDIPF